MSNYATDMLTKCNIIPDSAENLSDHLPIQCVMNVPIQKHDQQDDLYPPAQILPRMNWRDPKL